jgi:hypothetical protein
MRRDWFRQFFASFNRWEKLALAVWGVLLVLVCFRTAFWPKAHSVYPIFALASQHWLAGSDLYRLTEYDVYRYSPLVAVAFVPLGLLPLPLGGVLWRLLSAAIYLSAVVWWDRRLRTSGGDGVTRSSLALFLLLALPLSLDNLNNGQSNLLLMGLLMHSVLACEARRWNLAAVCMAIACLFKVYPIAVGLLLVVVYRRRFTLRFAAALVVGLLLPFVLQRPGYVLEEYATWIGYLRRDERQGAILELWYRDLRLLCRVLGMPLSAATYAAIQLTAGACIAAVCFVARRVGWPAQKLGPLLLGLGCCWMTAFGPATETSTYMLMAPMAAWYIVETWNGPPVLRYYHVSVYTLLLMARIAGWLPYGRRFSMVAQPTTSLLLFFGLLGIAIWQLHSWRLAHRETEPCRAQAA